MGSYHSLTMDEEIVLSTSESEDGSDSDSNYADIFQRLLQRYTNSSYWSSCVMEEHFFSSPQKPKQKYVPNTGKLDSSEFYFMTKLNSGEGTERNQINNITAMINNRCSAKYKHYNFTYSDKCKIMNNYLPNQVEIFAQYRGKVFCGIFSKDGDYFLTGSQDQVIRLYKTNNGCYKCIKEVTAQDIGWSIIDLAFSPRNDHFVYSTWSTSLHLCSVGADDDRQQPLCLVNTARRFCVFSLAYSSDGREILCGSNDGLMFIYDLAEKKRTSKFPAHDFDINSVAFADNSSQIIYSGSDDGLIKVWDRRTLGEENTKPVGVLAGHRDGITFIDSKGDGRHLISNSKDQSIKLWDVRVFSSEEAAANTLKAVQGQTWDYRWQNVPRRLIEIPKLNGDTSIMTYKGHVITRTLVRCRFSPLETTGQRYIYTGCGTGRLVIYDALTGVAKKEDKKHGSCVRDVAWHPTNNEIFTSGWDGCVGRWYYDENEALARMKASSDDPPILRRSARIAQQKSTVELTATALEDE